MLAATDVLELKQVVPALVGVIIGAILTLLGQSLTRRAVRAKTAKLLAMAFGEELSAVQFWGPTPRAHFAGFSSQTFDSLFREVLESLPVPLVRDLMRYHLRMKYMAEMQQVTAPASLGVNQQLWANAKELDEKLRERLCHYGQRCWLSIFLRPGEPAEDAI